ncbi:hypothetical protein, partial [Oscillibacter sp. CU971]|uniref:hypothetical protein n=1 Tax=Oscillibacter sp. CU971 TaxID=2780102 RepID=UPI00195BC43C
AKLSSTILPPSPSFFLFYDSYKILVKIYTIFYPPPLLPIPAAPPAEAPAWPEKPRPFGDSVIFLDCLKIF